MPEVRIAAEPRTEFGKGAARRIRRAGHVPAIIYGRGSKTWHITLPGHELMLALKTHNVLIRLDGVPGLSGLTLPKAIQRDPIKGIIEHADLLVVRRGEKVVVDVEVRLTGDTVPGGMLDQQAIQITVDAEPTHIPAAIEVDVTGMEIGTFVYASDLRLPSGVTLHAEPGTLVLHVVPTPTAEQIEAGISGAAEEAVAAGAAPAPQSAGEGQPG